MGSVAKTVKKAVSSGSKALGKVASKAVKTVGNVTKPVANGVGKVASGKVGEGLGDIGQTGARVGLDVATGGNKKIVDGVSGGLLTSAENAARGNTKDIARVGVTGGAALAGGPAAAFAANQVFARGGDATQAIVSGVTNSQGGEMGFLDDISSVLNSDLGKLALNAISPQTSSKKPAPVVKTVKPAVTQTVVPKSGMSTGMMVGIGAAVVGAVVLLVVLLKRK